jgi:hypothetical protein
MSFETSLNHPVIRAPRHHAARTVSLAKHRRQRATLPWYGKIWGHLQDITVGYGFRPMRAAAWLLTLLSFGTMLLPVIDFGQEHAYQPIGPWQWLGYALIAAGWILATTIAAGITRTITRQ